jgi:queuine tRNA-ribosyltransferase
MPVRGPFEIVPSAGGSFSMRDSRVGEPMHSRIGPMEEARSVYLEQASLEDRLAKGTAPLVLHDIGLGIAANALAAIELRLGHPSARPLHVESFETDTGALELALTQVDRFPFLAPYQDSVAALLGAQTWRTPDGGVVWKLHRGDFRDRLEVASPAELTFFDMYSPKRCPELWSRASFATIARASPRTLLITYSAATAVRSALILAGFHVGRGRATSGKAETTVARAGGESLEAPLDAAWLLKLERSHLPLPVDIPHAERGQAIDAVRAALETR